MGSFGGGWTMCWRGCGGLGSGCSGGCSGLLSGGPGGRLGGVPGAVVEVGGGLGIGSSPGEMGAAISRIVTDEMGTGTAKHPQRNGVA